MSEPKRQRAALGFEDEPENPVSPFSGELDGLDPAAPWVVPKPKKNTPAPDIARGAAEAGFHSREPVKAAPTPAPAKQQRRRRTGRNAQFNIKARPETIEAFTRIADANGWGLGEAFEKATELLEANQLHKIATDS